MREIKRYEADSGRLFENPLDAARDDLETLLTTACENEAIARKIVQRVDLEALCRIACDLQALTKEYVHPSLPLKSLAQGR